MAGQTILTPTEITREFLDILHSNMVIVKNMDRQYESKFSNSGISLSGKIGPTLAIRKPNQYTVRSGWTMAQQDITEQSVNLTIDTPLGIDLNFTDSELALTIDDFSQRYIEPAAKRLAAEVDKTAGAFILNNTFNQVGTIGTQPNAASMFLDAHRRVKEQLCPIDGGVACIISPYTEASVVGALTTIYNPQSTISAQYTDGEMSQAFGLKWYTSQVLSAHTNGTRTETTPVIAVGAVTGAGQTTLAVTGAGSLIWNKGDVFTIGTGAAGVLSVNPETKQTYPVLQQFVITTTVQASTTVTLTFTPAIYTSGPLQNVDASTLASTNNVITNQTGGGSGLASGVYSNDLVMHKKAFAFASCDLELPRGLDMAAKASSDGISLRFLRGYDIVNARMLSRMDIFFGLASLRPEWSTRIIGAKA